MTRGRVVSLTPEQVVARALYLAGEKTIHDLDPYVMLKTDTPEECPVIYYRLADHNGGADPTAPDPASRWVTPGGVDAVTCDCAGAAAWCAGFDRYQPERFPIYDGWINTNSSILESKTASRCFQSLGRPELGSMIVCASGSAGHKVGHVGTVVGYKLAEWDPSRRDCWEAVEVVDVAGRQGRANKRTTGIGWRGTGALFLRSLMKP